MKENKKYTTIKNFIDSKSGNKERIALQLDCTQRSIDRYIVGYKIFGKEFFTHKNKGRQPSHAFSKEYKLKILNLYLSKYYDAGFTHAVYLLKKYDNITISVSALENILKLERILSPHAHRKTKKKMSKYLKELECTLTSKKEKEKIAEEIMLVDSPHPRRPRSKYFGEMLQMDASVHEWFGGYKTQLHIAIDDATGTIVGAYFDKQETLNGYYNVFHEILTTYGIPFMFYTDNRTVFNYKKRKSPSIENATFTQFSYACKQLGVQLKTTSVPQAKGRVERLFRTLQARLLVELRIAGVLTIAQANAFLKQFIKDYNALFALDYNSIKSVFVSQPSNEKINLTLAVLSERKVDNGHCIRFNNKFYKLIDKNQTPTYYHRGVSVIVIKAFDKSLYATVNEKVFSLKEIPFHEHSSRNFDFDKIAPKNNKKIYIPPMTHPWKGKAFRDFVKKQHGFYEHSFEDMMYSQENTYK